MVIEIINPNEVEQMNIYVMYKAKKAFYEVIKKELEEELSWEEYVDFLRTNENVRMLIRDAIDAAYSKFESKSFDFENMEDINWQIEDAQLCQLYENNMGKKRIYKFMLETQTAYYHYLREKDKALKWSAFVNMIMQDSSKADVLKKAFLRGLTELEFSVD